MFKLRHSSAFIFTTLAAFIMIAPPQAAAQSGSGIKERVLTVGEQGEFSTIQQALRAADAGDTVRLTAGTYRESVVITRPVRLTGENTDTIRTILLGKAGAAALIIRSEGVVIENLKISGKNNTVADGLILRSGGAQLRNLLIEGFSNRGVFLNGAAGCVIHNCYFVRNRVGLALKNAEGNRIFRNFFFNNQLSADALLSAENLWNDKSGRGNFWSAYQGLDNGAGARAAGDDIGDTDLPHLGLDANPLVFPAGMRLLPGCDDCAAGGESINPTASDQAATSNSTTDHGDGTFTFTQLVDENSSAPEYTEIGFGRSICGNPSGAGFGWKHTFAGYNQTNIQILSVTLSIRAYDVDSEPWRGLSGEYDGITGDGSWLNPQYLQGTNGTWSVTNFDVDPSALLDGELDVYCNIDMNTMGGWCTTLDYSQIAIRYTLIDNDPPYTPTLTINPSGVPTTDDTLSVTVTGPSPADPDGDSVTYIYRWLVNIGTGSYIDDEFAGRGDHTGNTVPSGATREGDRWMVEVTPVDEHGARGTKNSVQFAEIGGTNVPPIANAGGDQTVNVGESCTLDGSGSSDTDGNIDAWLWELYSGGSWSSIGSTASISHTFSSTGTYTVRLTVTDDDGDSDDSLAYITVEEAGPANTPPVVSGIPDQTIAEGQSFAAINLDAYVSDAEDSDALINWAFSGNSQLSVSIVNRVATITAPSAEWSGAETITFTATDPGGLSRGDSALFTVTAVNDPPVVSGIPDQTIDEGESFASVSLDAYVTDPDNSDSEMNWAFSGNSQLSVSILNRVATISVPSADWNGAESITFTASDPGGLSGGDSALFTVTAVNDPPTISGSPATGVDEDSPYSFTPDADDIDQGDTQTFSIQNPPGWADFDPATGTLSGTPENVDVGLSENIIITVTDSQGASASLDPFSIEVFNTNDAPTVENPLADQAAVEDEAFSFTFPGDCFQDPDSGDVLSFSAQLSGGNPLPGWLTFTAETRAFSGTPGNDDTEALAITVTADDGNGGTVQDSFSLDVEAVNDAPTLDHPEAAGVDEDTDLPLPGITASDIDSGTGRLRLTLTVENGTLRLETGGADGQTTLNIEGTLTDINTALEGLIYRGEEHFNGSDSLNLLLDDLGNSGSGGALTDAGSLAIEVRPVNDAPRINAPAAVSLLEDEEILIPDLSIEDVDSGDGRLDVLITVREGRVFLNKAGSLALDSAEAGETSLSLSGDTSSLNAALARLTYKGAGDFNGRDEMRIAVNDNGHTGSGGWKAAEARIKLILTAVNDAPVADAGDVQHVGEKVLVTLDGSESKDPEGHSLTFQWEQISGETVELSDSTVPQPGFTAPTVESGGGVLEFKLTVEDPDGLRHADTTAVHILDGIHRLYFPRVISTKTQNTQITLINSDPREARAGRLTPFSSDGRPLFGAFPVEILPSGREEFLVRDIFSPFQKIAYLIFESDAPGVTGRLRYFEDTEAGVGFEALIVNSQETRLISRIASSELWQTEFTLINTSPLPVQPGLELDNGFTHTLFLQSREQIRFRLRDLFSGTAQEDAQSARLTDAGHVIGVQMISRGINHRPVLVDDYPETVLDFPFLPDSTDWWARLDFLNGVETREKINLTFYGRDGQPLGREKLIIPAGGSLSVEEVEQKTPSGTAWMRAYARNGISGEIIFGTREDSQLGGYSAGNLHCRQGVLPAMGDETGGFLTLVNSEKEAAVVTLQARDEAGNLLAECEIGIAAHARFCKNTREVFAGIPLETCSHITFTSDRLMLGSMHSISEASGCLHFVPASPTDID